MVSRAIVFAAGEHASLCRYDEAGEVVVVERVVSRLGPVAELLGGVVVASDQAVVTDVDELLA
jgi:hypothetical protein